MSAAPFRLDGRVGLVTGGGSGLGLAIATQLHHAGATVALVGRRRAPLEQAAETLGSRVHVVPGDVADLSAVPALVDEVAERVGPIDTLVHCAGVHVKAPLVDSRAEDDRALLDVHVLAGLALARAVAPRMEAAGGGSVLFIGSMAARMGVPQVAAYSAAKGGVTALARALAVELGPLGVRVNVITPGWIDTAMSRAALADDPERRARIMARTPLGRLGAPADVGLAAVYLASPAAAFVTGADLVVDGGAAVGF